MTRTAPSGSGKGLCPRCSRVEKASWTRTGYVTCVSRTGDNRPAFSYALGFCTVVTPVSVVDRWRAITSTTAGESSVTDRPARCRVSRLVTRPMHGAHEYWQLAQTLLPSHPYLSKHDARHRPAWPTAAWSCCQLRGHCSARNHRIISASRAVRPPPACLHRRTLSGSCPQPLPPRLSKFLGAIRVAVTSQRHVNANGHVGISNTRTAAPLSGTKRCPTTRDLTDIRIQHSVRCCAACPLRTHPPTVHAQAGPSRARLKPMRLSKPLNNPVTDH